MSETQSQAQGYEGFAVLEEWRSVPGFERSYEVSNLGQVRRSGKAVRHGAGRGGGARLGRLLTFRVVPGGYLLAQLWQDGKGCGRLVHRLVAAAFIGPLPDGHEVNHIDGDKKNNTASNLEYVTRSENNRHAYRLGLMHRGEAHVHTKLTREDVIAMRHARASGQRYSVLARTYGVCRQSVQAIVRGETWAHVREGL